MVQDILTCSWRNVVSLRVPPARVTEARAGGRGGEGDSPTAYLSYLTIAQASPPRRSTIAAPIEKTSNIWALITFLPYITVAEGGRGDVGGHSRGRVPQSSFEELVPLSNR